jgi:transcriptional regulator with XRE-family HTH domain
MAELRVRRKSKSHGLRFGAARNAAPLRTERLAQKLSLVPASEISGSTLQAAFGELVELRRRERGMSVQALAETADVELPELLTLEGGLATTPAPRTVFMLAQALHLPVSSLLALAGLAEARDPNLHEAAMRFLARERPSATLSEQDEAALKQLLRIVG